MRRIALELGERVIDFKDVSARTSLFNYFFRTDNSQKWTNEITPFCLFLDFKKTKISYFSNLEKRKEIKNLATQILENYSKENLNNIDISSKDFLNGLQTFIIHSDLSMEEYFIICKNEMDKFIETLHEIMTSENIPATNQDFLFSAMHVDQDSDVHFHIVFYNTARKRRKRRNQHTKDIE